MKSANCRREFATVQAKKHLPPPLGRSAGAGYFPWTAWCGNL